jgi:hypothetical protein
MEDNGDDRIKWGLRRGFAVRRQVARQDKMRRERLLTASDVLFATFTLICRRLMFVSHVQTDQFVWRNTRNANTKREMGSTTKREKIVRARST